MNELRYRQSLTGANPVRLTMPLVTMDRGAVVANGVVAKNQATPTPAPAAAPRVELDFDDFDGFTLRVAEMAAPPEPVQETPTSVVADTTGATQTDKEGARDRVKDILDKLVKNGTITEAQEDAILKAFKDAAGERKHDKAIFGDLFKLSSEYLGIPEGQLKKQLVDGKSLGDVANATSGKSRDGLITFLVQHVTAQIDKAVADGKLTKEQAEKLKSHLTEHVTKFVDHKFDRKAAPAKQGPKPSPSASPKA